MVVQALMAEHGMSQRRACVASGIACPTLRYRQPHATTPGSSHLHSAVVGALTGGVLGAFWMKKDS